MCGQQGSPGGVGGAHVPEGRGAHVPGGRAGGEEILALTHATLIAAPGSRAAEHDRTVLIRGGRVTAVGRTADTPVPDGARTLDLTGKYVIPGLIDAHTHSSGLTAFASPLYVLSGVTTVREMWGTPEIHAWRDRVERGEVLGPRWVVASTIVDGKPSLSSGDIAPTPVASVGTEAEAREAVRRITADGSADFIKVYTRLTRETFFALANEARRQGIRFAGHCPDVVPVTEASNAGQHSIEHLYPLTLSTSGREEEIRRAVASVRVDPSEPSSARRYRSWFQQTHPLESAAVRSYEPDRARRVFDHLARNGTYVTPTLGVHHCLERQDALPDREEEWKYLPAWLTSSWRQQLTEISGPRTPGEATRAREINDHRAQQVAELHRHGVPLLAGTDCGTPYLVAGFSLHDELARLTAAGLTPAHALRAATVDAAAALGLGTTLGAIAPGRAADLVILGADPLTDIRNTRRVEAVVTRGRLIDGEERQRLLDGLEKAAATS
ncbi:amidohydrolase family protein [Streptomyces sp. NPDC053048]|uniref:amidohydrolase family protein n=1 Tax=Streptomyces sp. NPDC053048 TaxID=3365694 RepID=UPI0037D4D48D